jgi:hypothetical protein
MSDAVTGTVEDAPVAAVPAPPRRVIGQDAEAALRERHAKASGVHLIYVFRNVEYRLLTPMPAAFLIHSGQIQSGDDVDMREFVNAIRSAFIDEDGQKFVDALMDNSHEIPADAEFISEVLTKIVEAVSERPSTK